LKVLVIVLSPLLALVSMHTLYHVCKPMSSARGQGRAVSRGFSWGGMPYPAGLPSERSRGNGKGSTEPPPQRTTQ
jgi:hypothetical protein